MECNQFTPLSHRLFRFFTSSINRIGCIYMVSRPSQGITNLLWTILLVLLIALTTTQEPRLDKVDIRPEEKFINRSKVVREIALITRNGAIGVVFHRNRDTNPWETTERQNHITNFDVERLGAEINQRNLHRRFLLADQSGDRVEANKLMYFFCAAIKVVMVEDNEKRWIRGRELL